MVFAVVFLQPAAGRLEELTFLEREGQAEIRRTAIGLARAQEKGFQRACPLARGLGCAIPAGSRAGALAAGGLGGARAGGHELRWPAARQEGAGDFIKPRVLLDGGGELFHAEIDGAQCNALALGVGAEPVQGARLATLAILPDG